MDRLIEFMERLKKEIRAVYPETPTHWAIENAVDSCIKKWQLEDAAKEEC